METKYKVIFILILGLIITSFTYTIFINKNNEELSYENPYDIQQLVYKYDDIKDYYELKDLNVNLMLFFKGINDKANYINVSPLYKEFYNLSDSYYIDKYEGLENVFYEIVSVSRNLKTNIVKVRYKEENKDVLYTSEFVIDGRCIVDEPFVRIDDILTEIKDDKFIINVIARVVYTNKSVYKIEITNLTNEIIEVDSDMYGFYAKDQLNKYYHKLIMNSSPYKIIPFSTSIYFVEIPLIEIDGLFININKKEIQLK